MTSNEPNESKRNVYDSCDPHYLRQLREAAGMDHVVLAKTACLSVAQVRQLETENSDSLFYSDAIKRQAYKRLLMILGAEPPTVDVPQDLRDPGKVAQAHLDTLDQIVAMSHQPSMSRSAKDVLGEQVETLKSHKQAIAASVLLAIAVVLFVLSDPKNTEDVVQAIKPAPVASAYVAAASAASQVAEPVVHASEPLSVIASIASQAQPASAPTVPIAPPPLVVASAPVVAAPKLSSCAYSNETMPQLTSAFAQKETRYVYLVGTTSADICVVDANKQATFVQLKAGEGRSVYGSAPWQISGPQLQKVQIFFQGARVSVPDSITQSFKLNEVPISR